MKRKGDLQENSRSLERTVTTNQFNFPAGSTETYLKQKQEMLMFECINMLTVQVNI
jgi:hypothetical protein